MNVLLAIAAAIGVWLLLGCVAVGIYAVLSRARDSAAGLRYGWADYISMFIVGSGLGILMWVLLGLAIIKDRR